MRAPRSTPFSELMEARLTRREALLGIGRGVLGAAMLMGFPATSSARSVKQTSPHSSLTFSELIRQSTSTHALPAGYQAKVLMRWGDKVVSEAPVFDVYTQTSSAQAKQFGMNCDYTAYMPLPRGSRTSDHGLLWVNHENPDPKMMFPKDQKGHAKSAREHIKIEMASVGGSLVEIKRVDSQWRAIVTSSLNRRITAETPIRISGPASGHSRMKTGYDPSGKRVMGTLANCAGGVTPWNTVLTCEENFHDYFDGMETFTHPERENHVRYDMDDSNYPRHWGKSVERFNVNHEPNEANRFGWVVEIDPYDPHSLPVKRTALGRFKHESATVALAPDNRVVVYSGDDCAYEYLYKFVSSRAFQPGHASANRDLLDEGVLYVAKFSSDGTLQWLPLVYGEGALTQQNGFSSQADVLIETRRAADLLGATPMDRPEDIEVHPATGRVYCSLTKNLDRTKDRKDKANPRAANPFGHILELEPPILSGKPDHAAEQFSWDIFILAGDPENAKHEALYPNKVTRNGWFTNPDNLAIDPAGRLWIATDGQRKAIGVNDGLYACEVIGDARGATRLFFSAPYGAEVTGPCFTPDGTTLFLSVQHPSVDTNINEPSTRWPDFAKDSPPRSSVLAITKNDGGAIGS